MKRTRFFIALLAGVTAFAASADAETRRGDTLTVHSYASQVNDVDSVNSHWFETDAGVVLIDAQRLLPEARRALTHLRATTDKPLTAIVITHAHTDHYGGLPVWTQAFPEATVYTDRTTLASIRDDRRGFIDMRNRRHGERFASHQALLAAVADAESVTDGERIVIGNEILAFTVVGPSEAESTVIVDVVGKNTAFIGDLINEGAPAVPFESLDNWLAQLDLLAERFDDNDRLYQGHGPAPLGVDAITEQGRFLRALSDAVTRAIQTDNTLTTAEVEQIVFELEAGWPFYEGVAGNTRQQVLGFAARQIARQRNARVDEQG